MGPIMEVPFEHNKTIDETISKVGKMKPLKGQCKHIKKNLDCAILGGTCSIFDDDMDGGPGCALHEIKPIKTNKKRKK